MSSIFWYQPFVATPGNVGGKVPVADDVWSSNEQKILPIDSVDESCIGLNFKRIGTTPLI